MSLVRKATPQSPVPATDTPSPAAWGFVLQHASVIENVSRRCWTDSRMEVQDFHHELIVDIVRNFHKFTPDRGGPSSWVWVRARHVKDHLLRSLSARPDRHHGTRRVLERDTETGAMIDPQATGWGSHETIVVHVELDRVVSKGTPAMVDACRSVLEEWTGQEVRDAFGCTMTARNDRIRRLGARILKEG